MADNKIAFVCGTPLQIIGAISIATELKKDGSLCDAFLRHDFTDSHGTAARLREYGPFDNVYDVGYSSEGNWSIRGTESIAFTEPPYVETAAASLLDQTGGETDGKGYDGVFCSYPYDTGLYLMAANNGKARLYRYDDGIGSYLPDAMGMHGFVETWLFRPDMAESQASSIPIKQIPFDSCIAEMAAKVFGQVNSDEYDGKRIVLLTQPVDAFNGRQCIDSEIRDALAPYSEYVIIRKHPRDSEPDDRHFAYDTRNDSWELMCALGRIPDDAILIGGSSTAQAMPHMIGDSKSHAIFTNPMYREAMTNSQGGKEYARADEAVTIMERLLGQYAIRVDNVEELSKAIEKLI